MSEEVNEKKANLGQIDGLALSRPLPLQEMGDGLDLAHFSCGQPTLNEWLTRRAAQAEAKTARTYIVHDDGRVVAYYCLCTGHVRRAELPRKYRHDSPDPIPVFVLGRLAVDQHFQGMGLGSDLVQHCFLQCINAAEFVGSRGLIVHPLNEAATNFYANLGFIPLSSASQVHAMFLPIETIIRSLA